MKQGRLQYIYKKAFDHLPFAVPRDSTLTDEEPPAVVNIALAKISTCSTDSCLCGYENQQSQSTVMLLFMLGKQCKDLALKI
jgi:hypothetical protein